MFGLGMMEIGLIIVIAVMLFPPTELPKLVRSIARVYGQLRRTAEDFKNTVLEDEDLRSPIDEIKGAYNDARWEIKDAERKARQQLAKAQMEMRMATARRIQAEREAEAKATEAGAEPPAVGAASAAPMRIAAAAPDEAGESDESDESDAPSHGPVAAADPRVIAAARAGAYTPPAPREVGPGEPADEGTAASREGVA